MALRRKALVLIVAFGLFAALPAHADNSPEAQAAGVIRTFYGQLTSTLKQGDQLGFAGRYKKLDPAIRAAFDLPFMAKVSVGSSWSSASPQEQAELVNAFSDFSVSSYASRFVNDQGEQFSINSEIPTASGIIVSTSLIPRTGDAVQLNYLMRPDDSGHYRIVDVLINGTISELATRRAEFSSIARRDGIEALAHSLDQKSREMGPT